MDFEGRLLSNKKVVEEICRLCVPVVADNYHQVKENPRNKELFDEIKSWGGGLLWVVSPDKKLRKNINYRDAGTVANFLKLFSQACKELEKSKAGSDK